MPLPPPWPRRAMLDADQHIVYSEARMTYTGPTDFPVVDVLDVHDGDTFHLQVELGFHAKLTIDVRLEGWDCPEIGYSPGRVISAFEKARAREARDMSHQWLGARYMSGDLRVTSAPDPQTFNRWLGVVYSTGSPNHEKVFLGEVLAHANLAVPWHKSGDLKWWQVYDRPGPGSTIRVPTIA